MRPNQFPVISVLDEAIDTESIQFDTMVQYYKTRDIKLLEQHVHPGQQPTRYLVRAVPHGLWESFVGAAGDNLEMRYRRAFMCGVISVANLRGDDGVSVLEWKPTRPVQGMQDTFIMTDDECNGRFAPSEVLEIGSVIYEHSFLPRRRKLTWPLPPMLFEQLANLTFRPAAPSQTTASTQTSSTPSDGGSQTTTVTESLHA